MNSLTKISSLINSFKLSGLLITKTYLQNSVYISGLVTRLTTAESNSEYAASRVFTLEQNFNNIQSDFNEIKNNFNTLSEKVSTYDSKIENLESNFENVPHEVITAEEMDEILL